MEDQSLGQNEFAEDKPPSGSPKKDHSVFAKTFFVFTTTASFFANVAVVAGIIFAVYQIKQTNAIEKRRIAIEAVSQARSTESLRAIHRLEEAVSPNQTDKKKEYDPTDDLNQVMHVYDHIAIIYINDIADRCIIKNSVHEGARQVLAISNAFTYPPEYKKNINSFLKMIETEQERCDVQFLNSNASK